MRESPAARTTSDLPFVTVLMPVRNEERFLPASLRRVLAQDYPDLEVLVVDGRSEDGTAGIVRSLQGSHPNLFLVENPKKTAPAALNAGLRRARGEIVIRVDGHCEIRPDYVRRCVAHLSAGKAEGVGGPVDTVGWTRAGRAIAIAMSSPFGVGGCAFRTKRGGAYVDSVPFPAYTREAIERAGPFDEELTRNQDDEYNYRLRALGGRILLAEDLRTVYHPRERFSDLARQYFQYGYWKVRVLQKHPAQMMPRQFAPPLLAAFLGASLAASPFSFPALALLAGGAGLYGLAAASASVLAARGPDRRLRPLVGAAFATLHLSYGAGFLAGLVRFAGRWGSRRGSGRAEKPIAGRTEAARAQDPPGGTRFAVSTPRSRLSGREQPGGQKTSRQRTRNSGGPVVLSR